MRYKSALFMLVCAVAATIGPAYGQSQDDLYISPSRPVPTGKAPSMRAKQIGRAHV